MPVSKNVVIITYNAVDGACAAAVALLKFPKADVRISSAAGIGRTFASIAGQKKVPDEVHVCGVGVYCDWVELEEPAEALRSKKTQIYWHCGRGYLDEDRELFEGICTPVFQKARTNTEAVCLALGLRGNPGADALAKIAEHDVYAFKADHPPTEDESRWLDLVEASNAAYFKYQDTQALVQTIRKLATGELDRTDQRAIELFRKTGYKYVLYGRSPQLKKLRQTIQKCARVDEPVLILGETGVGKEHVAHLIHEGSPRATGPFVSVNCAVFSGNAGLANSILFGHVAGAFTGAEKKRDGAFVTANGGTLFLDELGELPPEVQPKFLRVLDDGEVIPEGADQPVQKVSVRLIGATNRDLPAMIRKGFFRADLFHRLATLRIQIPPLRDRKEDLEAIVEHTLDELPEKAKRRELTKKEYALLRSYDWPGNVRQVIRVLKQAMYLDMPVEEVLADERALGSLTLAPEDGDRTDKFLPTSPSEIQPMEEVRRAYARKAFDLNHGNWTATAKALRLAVNTLRTTLRHEKPL
jgi:DNA-binding NtrC family response regulator